MRKCLSFILAIGFCLALSACGKKSSKSESSSVERAIQALEEESKDNYKVISDSISNLNWSNFDDALNRIKDVNFKLPGDDFLIVKLIKLDAQKNPNRESISKAMLTRLLQKGANKLVSSNQGIPALSLAIDQDRLDFFDILIHDIEDTSKLDPDLNSLLNALDKNKESPLFYAIRSGDQKLINQLIDLGANVEQINVHGQSVVDLLPADQFPEALSKVQDIIADKENGLNPNPQNLLRAIENDNIVIVKNILKRFKLNQFMLVEDILTRIVGMRRMPNRLAIAKLLLDAGASPSGALPSARSPLMEAARLDDDEMALFLLQNAPTTANAADDNGITALITAIDYQKPKVTRILIRNSLKSSTMNGLKLVNVDQADKNGRTPLQYAVLHNDVDTANLLVNDSSATKISVDHFGINSCKLSVLYRRSDLETIKDDKVKKQEIEKNRKIRDEILKCLIAIDYSIFD